MKSRTLLLLPLLLIAVTTPGCDLLGDVIEFGFWVGVIVIGIIVLLIYMIFRWLRGRR